MPVQYTESRIFVKGRLSPYFLPVESLPEVFLPFTRQLPNQPEKCTQKNSVGFQGYM